MSTVSIFTSKHSNSSNSAEDTKQWQWPPYLAEWKENRILEDQEMGKTIIFEQHNVTQETTTF